MGDVLVIGIAGGSGSGKTTLQKRLVERFGDEIAVLSHDNYYRAHDDMPFEERCRLNYDHPDAFETEMMVNQLRELKAGRTIHCPTYDYTNHNRAPEVLTVEPRPVIVVEGILILRIRPCGRKWTSRSSWIPMPMCGWPGGSGGMWPSGAGPWNRC